MSSIRYKETKVLKKKKKVREQATPKHSIKDPVSLKV